MRCFIFLFFVLFAVSAQSVTYSQDDGLCDLNTAHLPHFLRKELNVGDAEQYTPPFLIYPPRKDYHPFLKWTYFTERNNNDSVFKVIYKIGHPPRFLLPTKPVKRVTQLTK